jgi:UDP-glucose 4-epimerase
MKALVTGGAGFMGSHIVDELIKKGIEVVVLDDLSGGFEKNVNPEAKFFQGDIGDKVLLEKIFSENNIDYIFHLAAYAAEGLSHFIRKYNYNNNLMGSINLINLAIKNKVKCFVFTSSIAVYGENQLPMKEETIPKPGDPYGISKYAVELDLESARKMFGLEYIIFRPHNVYGERQNIGDKYRNVIGIFMNKIMQNESLKIFGDGEQTRAFSHIADIVPIIADSVFKKEAYNKVFNIGADEPYSVNLLAKEVIKSMGVSEEYPIDYEPARNEVTHAYSNHARVKELLGYRTTVSLEDGVKRMAEWAKKEGPKKSKEFDDIEITEKLPPSWKK